MKNQQRGIALLEALVAILILGVGVLGMIGLQGKAYSSLSDAGMRAEATMAGDKLVGVMTNDLANAADYALAANATPGDRIKPWLDETKAAIPGAKVVVAVAAATGAVRVDIDIKWTRKTGDRESRHHVTSYLAKS
jgi:type IV pilus assembly protein PilV